MLDTSQDADEPSEESTRYARQVLFAQIGEAGQRRLLAGRATLIGCGALGSVQADTLVRAGVGRLRICDRDFIERDNLQRQVLFDESDIAAGLPKAEAAARKLRRINSTVRIEAVVADVTPANIERLAGDADVLLDGTDNFETRYLINDYAVKTSRPWVYGAVVGATGLCMAVLPGQTPCLRCLFADAPPAQMNPTCDTAGVLGSAVHLVAGMQATEAIKILAGRADAVNRHLTSIDAWTGRVTNVNVQRAYLAGDCPCCHSRCFDYLDGRAAGSTTKLCGRHAVQINPAPGTMCDLPAIGRKLRRAAAGTVRVNEFMLQCTLGDKMLTLFADGRAIVKGTDDADLARSLYARYVGA